jgi:hypothetical protein
VTWKTIYIENSQRLVIVFSRIITQNQIEKFKRGIMISLPSMNHLPSEDI